MKSQLKRNLFLTVVSLSFCISLTLGKKSIYDFTLQDIDGNEVKLESYKGKTLLLILTASQCSHTDSTLKALKRMHEILSYTNKFEILAFPCNDFGEQEPWDEAEIKEFIRGHFKAEFPIFKKVKVLGEEKDQFWDFVIQSSGTPPTWNFHKYLFNAKGEFVSAWPAESSIESIFETVQNTIDTNEGSSDETNGKLEL